MAAKKTSTSNTKTFQPKPRAKRPGIVSKNNTSSIKSSRNYKKTYKGQGR